MSLKSDWCIVRCCRLLCEIDMIASKLANTNNECWWPLRKFFGPLKGKNHVCKNTFFENFNSFRAKNCLWVGIKSEKLPLAYVCVFIIWLKCRAMLPFALGDRYGPKQACKHQRVLVTRRKIFRTTQRQTSRSQKHNFWGFQTTSSQILPLSGYQI